MADEITEGQHKVIFTVILIQCIIAVIFQLFIVFSYFRFKELRKRSYEQVVLMSVTSIAANVTYAVGPPGALYAEGSAACTAQGFLMNFFDLTTVGWTLNIAWSLYFAVVLQQRPPRPAHAHAAVWGGAGLLAGLPLTTSSYGQSGPWCWIAGDAPADQAWRFVSFYVPLWCAFGLNAYLYFAVSTTLKRYAVLSKAAKGDRLATMAEHLQYYPLIFVASWAVNTVVRVVQAGYPESKNDFNFVLVHVVFHGSFYQAVGNTFAFGLNDAVKAKWRAVWLEVRAARSWRPLCNVDARAAADGENDFVRDDQVDGEGPKAPLAAGSSSSSLEAVRSSSP